MIQIRRATLADEPSILQLAPRLVAFGPPPWRDVEGMRATDRAMIAAALRAEGHDPMVLVATVSRDESASDEVAGFIHLNTALDYYTQRKNAHVSDLVVAESFEGQGIARKLLGEAEKWARSIGSPWLSIAVFEQNARAAGLYERLGFKREIVRMLMPLD